MTDYPSLNPFYEETESEITDDQTELDNNSIMSIDKPFDKREDNKYPSLLDLLNEETTRIDRLQSNISVIKRQASLQHLIHSLFFKRFYSSLLIWQKNILSLMIKKMNRYPLIRIIMLKVTMKTTIHIQRHRPHSEIHI